MFDFMGIEDATSRMLLTCMGFHGDDPILAFAGMSDNDLEELFTAMTGAGHFLTFGQKGKVRGAHRIACHLAGTDRAAQPIAYHIHNVVAGPSADTTPVDTVTPELVQLCNHVLQHSEGKVKRITDEEMRACMKRFVAKVGRKPRHDDEVTIEQLTAF